MKRIWSVCLCILFLLTAMPLGAFAAEDTVALPCGNVDGEGEVTAADALLTLQAATGKVMLSDHQKLIANVDGEGDVTASDALMILQYATKKINSFPVQDADDNTGDDNTGDDNTGEDEGLGSGDGVEDTLQ